MTDQPQTLRFIVSDVSTVTRFDQWLTLQMTELSRARVQSLIADGQVTLEGKVVTSSSLKLKPGECDGQIAEITIPPVADVGILAQDIPLVILHEDDDVIVVDKPAGLVVHPGAGNPDGTLVNALLAHCGPGFLNVGGEARPGIVHRLDKDTSGVMIAAKNDKALTGLQQQFAERTIEREYLAVVEGLANPTSGSVEGDIGRDPRHRTRMAMVERGGKYALTHYKTREVLGDSRCSIVACRLATGRTHQIRVHLGSIGVPLIGDVLYGRKGSGQRYDFRRQALHARSLGFTHPITQEWLSCESALPRDMLELIGRLQKFSK